MELDLNSELIIVDRSNKVLFLPFQMNLMKKNGKAAEEVGVEISFHLLFTVPRTEITEKRFRNKCYNGKNTCQIQYSNFYTDIRIACWVPYL